MGMASNNLNIKQLVLVLGLVAVAAIVLAVITAEHISALAIIIIAGVILIASLVLNGYIAAERKKLQQQDDPKQADESQPPEK